MEERTLFREIENDNGTKARIMKHGDLYDVEYWEYYSAFGWRLLVTDENYTYEAIAFLFDL